MEQSGSGVIQAVKRELCWDHVLKGCDRSKEDCAREHPDNLDPRQPKAIDYKAPDEEDVACARCLSNLTQVSLRAFMCSFCY